MLYLENVYHVICQSLERYDEVWFITRDASQVQDFLDAHEKVKLRAALSPQPELFRAYRALAEQGRWDQTAFDRFYVPRFLKDLSENPEGLALLRELKERSAQKEIALACFCEDERMCHRSIVGGILRNMGASIDCAEVYGKYKLPSRTDLLKKRYKLEAHPEGGWFSEEYTAPFEKDGRPMAGSIYYLLDAGEISQFHQIDCDELWYYHEGCGLIITSLQDGVTTEYLLGPDVEHGQRAMAVIPKGAIFSAKNLTSDGFTFVSCVTTPKFTYEGFRLVDVTI